MNLLNNPRISGPLALFLGLLGLVDLPGWAKAIAWVAAAALALLTVWSLLAPMYRLRSPIRTPLVRRDAPSHDRQVSRRERKQAAVLRTELAVLWRSSLREAADQGNRALTYLIHEVYETETPAAGFMGLLRFAVADRERADYVAVSNALFLPGSDGHDDPRRLQQIVGEWWRSYLAVGGYIQATWDLTLQDGNATRVVGDWLRADKPLCDELRRLAARQEFEGLRGDLTAAGDGSQLPLRVAPPMPAFGLSGGLDDADGPRRVDD